MRGIIQTMYSIVTGTHDEEIAGSSTLPTPETSTVSLDIAHGLDIHRQRERLRAFIGIFDLAFTWTTSSWSLVVIGRLFITLISVWAPLAINTDYTIGWNWDDIRQIFAIPIIFFILSTLFREYLDETLNKTFHSPAVINSNRFVMLKIKRWHWGLFTIIWLMLGARTLAFLWPYWTRFAIHLSSQFALDKGWLDAINNGVNSFCDMQGPPSRPVGRGWRRPEWGW